MNNYWKSKLTSEQQTIYDKMLVALNNRQQLITIPKTSDEKLMECFWSVQDDHPELFYVLSRIGCGIGPSDMQVQFDYLYSANTTYLISNEIEKIINDIKNKTNLNNDRELENAIINAIVPRTKYQIDDTNNQSAASALYYRKAQCSGFARGFKYLADKLGLWSICVRGSYEDPITHNTIAHEWNIVKIDNEYYHLDLTSLLSYYETNGSLDGAIINSSDEHLAAKTFWDKAKSPNCNNILINVNNCLEKLSSSNIFTRLYDFKQLILNSAKNNKKTIVFQLKISQYTDDKLQKMAIDEIQKQFKNVAISLKIYGNIYVVMIK